MRTKYEKKHPVTFNILNELQLANEWQPQKLAENAYKKKLCKN